MTNDNLVTQMDVTDDDGNVIGQRQVVTYAGLLNQAHKDGLKRIEDRLGRHARSEPLDVRYALLADAGLLDTEPAHQSLEHLLIEGGIGLRMREAVAQQPIRCRIGQGRVLAVHPRRKLVEALVLQLVT